MYGTISRRPMTVLLHELVIHCDSTWYNIHTYIRAELLFSRKQKTAFRPYSFLANVKEPRSDKEIENILFACILASVFVSVRKWSFRQLLSLRYLNSSGMNLNWARINLREKEKQLSFQYVNIP